MTESEYTPTTERVGECYVALRRGSGTYAPGEFDRWLREHDARVWDEGYGDDLTAREPRTNPYRTAVES